MPSFSGQPQQRAAVIRMVQWTKMIQRLYYLQYSDRYLLAKLNHRIYYSCVVYL